MRRVARAAVNAVARGARSVSRRPLGSVAAVAAVAVGFSLLALAATARHGVDRLTGAWAAQAGMIVYLEDGTGEVRARQIGEALAALPAVEQVTYVSPDRAVAQMGELFGPDSEVTRGLEPRMLPASLEVVLSDGALEVARTHPLVERLEAMENVEEVAFAGPWIDRARALSSSLRRGAFWLTLLVAVGCGYVVLVTIRLRQADGDAAADARAWSMLGASGWFVRGPLLVEGALLGALGAAAGAGIAFALFAAAREPAAAALGEAFGPLALSFAPAGELARLVGLGAGLGLIAGLAGDRGRAGALA